MAYSRDDFTRSTGGSTSGSRFSRGDDSYVRRDTRSGGASNPYAGGSYSSNRSTSGNAYSTGRVAGGSYASDRASSRTSRDTADYGDSSLRRISATDGGYRTARARNPYGARRRKRSSPVPALIALILVLGVVGGGVWFFYNEITRHFTVTANGETIPVVRGDTVATLLDDGHFSPTPGNLLAVDGSLLAEGGGARCSVIINGEEGDENTELTRDAVLEIGNGGDLTEPATTSEEVIPVGSGGTSPTFDVYWAGSIHLLSDGHEGLRRTSTGTISGITVSEDVVPVLDAGFHVYTANTGEDRVVALTFDDGPWPDTTDAILDILEQYDAKATFFTIGYQVEEWPEPVRRAYNMGCQVCTHTWDHAAGSGQGVNITYMGADEQISEVTRGYQIIADVTGQEPSHVFRAPGGNFYGSAVSTLWPYVDAEIGWDVDTEDWRQPGSDVIAQRIISVQPGQVILMHDGGGDRWQTVEGLRAAMPVLVEQGYRFVTIDELLEYGAPA